MYTTRAVVLVSMAIAVLAAGCSSLWQQNIRRDLATVALGKDGLILGSVTAPPEALHEIATFHYRSVGDGGKTSGYITSATIGASPAMAKIPQCDEDGLAGQCGRLFAIRLPAGEYEFYATKILGDTKWHQLPPLGFAVAKGRSSYLGNLHTLFFRGIVPRAFRGGILGGDVSVRDEYDRDVALLRAKYTQLAEASIDKQLLPDRAWRWRSVSEPYDWGTSDSKWSQADGRQFSQTARFVDSGNGTVTDGVTGLIWMKDWNCDGLKKWKQGNDWAAALADGQCGLTDGSSAGDWRLPAIEEWRMMIDTDCSPAIPNTVGTGCWSAGDPFTKVASSYYWSAPSTASLPSKPWAVGLHGFVYVANKGALGQVVAVRGGP